MDSRLSFLRIVAQENYRANLVLWNKKYYLAAGANQFKTLWVRDFCFSVPGLLTSGDGQVVFDQLDLILKFTTSDGLIPRGLDVVNPKTRVLLNTILRFLPKGLRTPSYEGRKIHPEYKGEHGTRAFDSLLLVPWAITLLCLSDSKENQNFGQGLLQQHETRLAQVFSLLKRSLVNGLFTQEAFSDWQDSTRREGQIFTSHMLYLRLRSNAEKLNLKWFSGDEWPTVRTVFERFFVKEKGVFRNSLAQHNSLSEQVSLEAHLWLLQDDTFGDFVSKENIYQIIKSSKAWRGVPVFPASALSEVAWTTKVVGLGRYHDGMIWSWLLAECFKTAIVMQDFAEAKNIAQLLEDSVLSTKMIYEVYEGNPSRLLPVKTALYSSEHPFSWGACKWLEALGTPGAEFAFRA